jgi:hypothetical protein
MRVTRSETVSATFRGIRILFALAFVVVATFAMNPLDAGAQKPKSQMTHKERAEDFADGCGNAGGKAQILESADSNTTHVRCDMGDYAVSCVYQQTYGGVTETCVDSRGIQASPRQPYGGFLSGPSISVDATPSKGAGSKSGTSLPSSKNR